VDELAVLRVTNRLQGKDLYAGSFSEVVVQVARKQDEHTPDQTFLQKAYRQHQTKILTEMVKGGQITEEQKEGVAACIKDVDGVATIDKKAISAYLEGEGVSDTYTQAILDASGRKFLSSKPRDMRKNAERAVSALTSGGAELITDEARAILAAEVYGDLGLHGAARLDMVPMETVSSAMGALYGSDDETKVAPIDLNALYIAASQGHVAGATSFPDEELEGVVSLAALGREQGLERA
jgi:hypothetical protein